MKTRNYKNGQTFKEKDSMLKDERPKIKKIK